MRQVSSRTRIPVPRVYGFDIAARNSFGFHYVLMEALPGRILDSRFSQSVPQTRWDKIADQLADYYHQLSPLRFERIGRISCGLNMDEESYVALYNAIGPFATSLEYFYTFRKSQNRATIA
jgi:isoamyl acetate esterase